MIPDPWQELMVPSANNYSRLRVSSDTPYDMFWIRTHTGHVGLLITLPEHIPTSSLNAARVSIRHIRTDVVQFSDSSQSLVIILEDRGHQDIFLKLCDDLTERVVATDRRNVFLTVCKRLKSWQMLLATSARTLLSASEVQGLFAELSFIAQELSRHPECEELLIRGWEGPDRTQHDFILPDRAIEIKSVLGNQRAKIRISSEDQLYTHLEELYLNIYFLSETSSPDGESLNAIAQRISGLLNHEETRSLFESKLQMARYIDISEYDRPVFRIHDCSTYQIQGEFPRITPEMLQSGIENVSYDLILSHISSFRVTSVNFWR